METFVYMQLHNVRIIDIMRFNFRLLNSINFFISWTNVVLTRLNH